MESSQERVLPATDLKTICEVTALEIDGEQWGCMLHSAAVSASLVRGWLQGEACEADTKLNNRHC